MLFPEDVFLFLPMRPTYRNSYIFGNRFIYTSFFYKRQEKDYFCRKSTLLKIINLRWYLMVVIGVILIILGCAGLAMGHIMFGDIGIGVTYSGIISIVTGVGFLKLNHDNVKE